MVIPQFPFYIILMSYMLMAAAVGGAILTAPILKKTVRKDVSYRYFALFSTFLTTWFFCAGLSYILASYGFDYEVAYRSCWFGWLLIPSMTQWARSIAGKQSRIATFLIRATYLYWAVVLIALFTTNLIDAAPRPLHPYVNEYSPLERPIRYFGLLQGSWMLFEFYYARRFAKGVTKARLDYILLGGFCFGTPTLLITTITPVINPAIATTFLIPWLMLTLYAVTRYRLFEIKIIILNLVLLTALAIAAIVFQVGMFKAISPHAGNSAAIALSLIILFLAFNAPFSRRIYKKAQIWILHGKYDYQDVLRDSAQAVLGMLDIKELAGFILQNIKDGFLTNKVLFFMKGDDGEYRLSKSFGVQEADFNDFLDTRTSATLLDSASAFITEEEIMKDENSVLAKKFESSGLDVVIPMISKNSLIGMICVGNKGNRDPYNQSDIETLEIISRHLAIALENAQLYQEATTDGLTGLYHHKFFKQRLKNEVKRAERFHHALSLLMIDIDFFKKINDTYGHPVGDTVLSETASKIKNSLRPEVDIAARYGGEEFGVLLPETPDTGATVVAERIRKNIAENSGNGSISVTVSVGISSYAPGMEDETILRIADDALYAAKKSGRNKVVCSSIGKDGVTEAITC